MVSIGVDHPDAYGTGGFRNGAVCGGNPLIGRQTATALCAPCHQIGGTHRDDDPPSFVDIANMPSTTALSLMVFLRSNHQAMPNLIISDSDTDDLIAYILALKQPSARDRR